MNICDPRQPSLVMRELTLLLFITGLSCGTSTSQNDSPPDAGQSTGSDSGQASDGGGPDAFTGGGAIPDPGGTAAPPSWEAPDGCCGTPETALPLGVVSNADQPYVQGNAVDGTHVFYVFRAGPALSEVRLELNEGGPSGTQIASIEHVHLHTGAGLSFGPLIDPAMASNLGGTWAVEPGGIYVLEVATASGGFF